MKRLNMRKAREAEEGLESPDKVPEPLNYAEGGYFGTDPASPDGDRSVVTVTINPGSQDHVQRALAELAHRPIERHPLGDLIREMRPTLTDGALAQLRDGMAGLSAATRGFGSNLGRAVLRDQMFGSERITLADMETSTRSRLSSQQAAELREISESPRSSLMDANEIALEMARLLDTTNDGPLQQLLDMARRSFSREFAGQGNERLLTRGADLQQVLATALGHLQTFLSERVSWAGYCAFRSVMFHGAYQGRIVIIEVSESSHLRPSVMMGMRASDPDRRIFEHLREGNPDDFHRALGAIVAWNYAGARG